MLSVRLLRAARQKDERIVMEPADLDVLIRFSLDREDPSTVAKLRQNLKDAARR
jgi:hypothetical protein